MTGQPRVLLAEHVSTLGQSLADHLEIEGIEAVVTSGGDETRDALLQHDTIEVLIANLSNPNLNGFALARRVKKDYPHIAVILMTNQWDEAMVAQAKGCGVDECFTKDSKKGAESLIALIKKHLQS